MAEDPRAPQAPGNELLLFLADLGAALSAIGETVDAVELRLALIARAYGLEDARFSAFPTSLFLTLGRGEAATIEPTRRLSATPRLDQIAAVHRLAEEAERGAITPGDGIARLEEIRSMGSRYGPLASVLGYTTLTIGIALILRPAPRDVAAAAVLGTVVGVLQAARAWAALARGADALPRRLRRRLADRPGRQVRGHRSRPAGDDRLPRRLHPRRRADDGGARADRGPDDLRLEPARLGQHAARPDRVRDRRGRQRRRGARGARVLQLRRAPRRLGALARRARLRRRCHDRPLDTARLGCCRCSSSSTPRGPARFSATLCSARTRAVLSAPS